MNVSPDGAQPAIRNTIWQGKEQVIGKRGLKVVSNLCYSVSKTPLQILEERNLLPTDRKIKKEDMVKILSECEDFKNEKPVVVKTVESRGHRVIFLPKFHCEPTNPIERVWCQTKRFVRERCDYTYPSLKANVEKCMDEVSVQLIRKYFRTCRDYCRAYGAGATSATVETHRQIYKSHRRVYGNVKL
eukprot:Pompholyxophrys_punicea_v1_NODE_67_length_3879_cov_6.894201.p1 type:complete len:187 gc:universal NODE_67_length_3879_cov_6.894201:616-56(-)